MEYNMENSSDSFSELVAEIKTLTERLRSLESSENSRWNKRQRGERTQSRGCSISRNPGDPNVLCRYHLRYKHKAHRCVEPCAWNKRNDNVSRRANSKAQEKQEQRVQSAADDCAQPVVNHRLSVMDYKSGLRFLVDSGANVSVFPRSYVNKNIRVSESGHKLYAANGTEIKTYGLHTMELDLRLRRSFKWIFIIADVSQPIIGADFLVNFKLLIDLSCKRLVDKITNLNVIGSIVTCSIESAVRTIVDSHPFSDLLLKYVDITKPFCFKENIKHKVYHHIETTGAPVHAKARPLPPDRYVKAKKEFQVMQELGICRPSKSAWASPLHIVPKKDGNIRPCGDYRRLNAVTKPDRYPIPRLQNFTYLMSGKKVYSRLDVNRAFNCIPVAEEDIEKTAVITPFGLWEFCKLPFGLRNSAQTFQRFIDNDVLNGLDFIFAYIDDVIIASDDIESHGKHLEEVFRRFDENGLTINISKCVFAKEKLEFLGYEVSTTGIRPLDHKVKAIVDFPRPTTVEELRRYLGMLNFYRSHMPHAADQQAEMNKFLHNSKRKDKTVIKWTDEADDEFKLTKLSLQNAVLLSHPSIDSPVTLMTDASDTSVGASLQQREGKSWKPLGFFSKRLSDAQKKYSTYDRELLAIYLAIIHFRHLIEGRQTIILTDHKPLTYLFSKIGNGRDKETSRRARQIMFISEFTTDIRFINGKDNSVADCLSRIETISCPTVVDFAELATAQEVDKQLAQLFVDNNKLQFKRIMLQGSEKSVVCETSAERVRPYLTENFRRVAFDAIHNLSHPGINATRKLIKDRYFWKGMNKDISLWSKSCVRCQRSKVLKHTVSDLGQFQTTDRFQHIHIDIVGPLPISSEGYRYCVTMIDRCTKWTEAIPTKDISAETVAKAFYDGWISRFGCPEKLTSDQGRQFESNLFKELMSLLGINRIRTTPYHPQSNGAVERWHRSLKAALMARLNYNKSWIDELSTVMLGLRAAMRADTGVSAAEMVYGTTIRLPGEFYDEKAQNVKIDSESYVNKIRKTIDSYKPVTRVNQNSKKIFIHKDLKECQFVFVRNDSVRVSLQPPYDGPYKVLDRNDKIFKLQINNTSNVSIDRVKPAYILTENDSNNQASPEAIIRTSCSENRTRDFANDDNDCSRSRTNSTDDNSSDKVTQRTTRSGRTVKLPVRFRL